MRIMVPVAALFAFTLGFEPVCAFGHENKLPDQQSIAVLELRAREAKPRDRCFLYAKVVQQMTELSIYQYASGNVTVADRLLRNIQRVVQNVHLSLAGNDKRLVKAQILLSKTAFRLTQMLHDSNYKDRPLVKETLAEVNQAQRQTMLQIFQK